MHHESRSNLCDDNLPRLLMAEHHCSTPEAMQRWQQGSPHGRIRSGVNSQG
jgi:hypothetical protein